MGVKRICPNCKKTFITQKNAKVFCTKRCAKYLVKKKQKINKFHLCQWCAGKFRPSEYRTKFCSCSCRGSFVEALSLLRRQNIRKKAKNSTSEIERRSRRAGLSYGVYVAVNKL